MSVQEDDSSSEEEDDSEEDAPAAKAAAPPAAAAGKRKAAAMNGKAVEVSLCIPSLYLNFKYTGRLILTVQYAGGIPAAWACPATNEPMRWTGSINIVYASSCTLIFASCGREVTVNHL